MQILLSWAVRLVLIPLAHLAWWVLGSTNDIPIKNISLYYFKIYCILLILFICYLLWAVDTLVSLDKYEVNPFILWLVGFLICFLLEFFFPLVVLAHWIFCRKISVKSSIFARNEITFFAYLAIYTVLCLIPLLSKVNKLMSIITLFVRWRHFLFGIGLFHIYPCYVSGNYYGIVAALLYIVGSFLPINVEGVISGAIENSQKSTLVFFGVHLTGAAFLVGSFIPMFIPVPSLDMSNMEGSATKYFWYSLTYVGLGKVMANLEYQCCDTQSFYGVPLLKKS